MTDSNLADASRNAEKTLFWTPAHGDSPARSAVPSPAPVPAHPGVQPVAPAYPPAAPADPSGYAHPAVAFGYPSTPAHPTAGPAPAWAPPVSAPVVAPSSAASIPARVQGCPHAYPITERQSGLGRALRLSMKLLPYGLFRFAHWTLFAALSALMLIAAVGLGTALMLLVHKWVGVVVMFAALVPWAWFWLPFVERKTFGTKCAHIGMLTDLITHGGFAAGNAGQMAYAKQIVATRIDDMSSLYDVHRSTNRSLRRLTKVLDFIDGWLPIDVSLVKQMIRRVVRGSSRYLDAVILSYGFARGDRSMVDSAVEGIAYCAQNGRVLFKTAIGVLVWEKLLMAPVWLAGVAVTVPGVFAAGFVAQGGDLGALGSDPAAVVKAAPLPFLIAVAVALVVGGLLAMLGARTIRESLVQPTLLTHVMLRFHTTVEGQPLDPAWPQRIRDAGDGLEQLDRLRWRAS